MNSSETFVLKVEKMEEGEEWDQPVEAATGTSWSNAVPQDVLDTVKVDMDEMRVKIENDFGVEYLDEALAEPAQLMMLSPIKDEPPADRVAQSVARQQRTARRLPKKRKATARPRTGVVPYGSLNYPDDSSMDFDDKPAIFFDDEPHLYTLLQKWKPGTPVPCALKTWRNMLNDEHVSGHFQTPLNIFYRIFLNRQLGGPTEKIARIKRQRTASTEDVSVTGTPPTPGKWFNPADYA